MDFWISNIVGKKRKMGSTLRMNTYDSNLAKYRRYTGRVHVVLGVVLISKACRLAERVTAGQTTSVPILRTRNGDWEV